MAKQIRIPINPSVAADVTLYRVYRAGSPGATTQVFTVPKTADPMELVDRNGASSGSGSGLPDGTYYYRIRAEDTSGNLSGYSNEVSQIVDATGPDTPSLLSAFVEDFTP